MIKSQAHGFNDLTESFNVRRIDKGKFPAAHATTPRDRTDGILAQMRAGEEKENCAALLMSVFASYAIAVVNFNVTSSCPAPCLPRWRKAVAGDQLRCHTARRRVRLRQVPATPPHPPHKSAPNRLSALRETGDPIVDSTGPARSSTCGRPRVRPCKY